MKYILLVTFKTHDVLILTVVGDFMSFRLNLVSALTVGLVRPELYFRLTTKIVTNLINTFGILGNLWR